jgi:uncharacterized protein DUF6160
VPIKRGTRTITTKRCAHEEITMKFKKLALAAAVAALPATGFSMEALEDSALSGVTGQDGISIGLATDIQASVRIHDKDGISLGDLAGDAGALVIDGFAITRANATDAIELTIDADGGTTNTTGPTLNIGVSLPADLTVNLGTLAVAESAGASDTGDWNVSGNVDVINLGSMTMGATTLNIQLGNEPQGNMIALDTTITGGISISGFAVNDANSGGSLSANLSVFDNGGTDLTVATGIDIDNTSGPGGNGALVIGLDGIGGASGMDVRLADLTLGGAGAGAIGDVELVGLNLTGDLTIAGH